MANYNLVVNSKFKPFSFDEIAKPYLMYKQEYDTQQAALGELATKASVWENMANEQTDPVAYARYKAYSDNLKSQADVLATQGLNAGTKQALMNLRSDYATRITPIEQAFTTRQKQAEQQQQALLQDDSLLFSRTAATTSLDDYMANPQLQYDVKSGNKLTARVATAAQNLAKEFRENPEKMIPLVGKDYYEYIKKRGFSSEAILAAINNEEGSSQVLRDLVEDAVGATGIAGWNNQQALDAAYQYARQGLWSAIGQDESQLVTNWRAQQAQQQAFQAAEAEKQRQFILDQDKPKPMVDDNGNPTGRYLSPKTGMITDKDGNVITGKDGRPLYKVGDGTDNTSDKPGADQPVSGTNWKKRDFITGGTSTEGMKKLGYKPAFVTLKAHGKWQSLKEGEDIDDTLFAYTRTSLSSYWGNASFTPDNQESKKGMSWVEDIMTIPEGPREDIMKYVKENIGVDVDFQVVKVPATESRKNDYDYIIYTKE